MADIKEQLEQFNQAHRPPKVRRFLTKEPRGKDTRTLEHGAFLFEAYKHLERMDSPSTQEFVEAQNLRSEDFLSQNARRTEELSELAVPQPKSAYETPMRKNGDKYYSTWIDEKTSAYKYLVRSSPDEEPQVYIDSAQFSKDHGARVTNMLRTADGRTTVYSVMHVGSSTPDIHIMHIDDEGKITDRVHAQHAMSGKYGEEFRLDEDGKGFTYSQWTSVDSKSATALMRHRFGQESEEDETLALVSRPGSYAYPKEYRVKTQKGESSPYTYMAEVYNFGSSSEISVINKQTGELAATFKGEEGSLYQPLLEVDGRLLMRTNDGASMGKIISVNPTDPTDVQTIVAENPKDAMEGIIVCNGKLVVSYKHDAASRIAVHELNGTHLQDVPLPFHTRAHITAPKYKGADFGLSVSGFTHSAENYDYTIAENSMARTSEAKQRMDDVVVERVEATSKDGTKVPMTVIRRKDVKLDGTAATQMNGYGGFNIPQEAGWTETVKDWVSKGGIYVQTNLRGGGEFGRDWYNGGRLQNKQNVFDDFAACGEFLIQKGYTSSERLAISGGSNGGLLTLTSAVQRPDLFGAVVSQVPVADMLYDRWQNDYGLPLNDRADFEKAMSYSPVHNIKAKQKYPPMMVTTGAKDPTVPAWHAYKFVATMQEKSPDTLCLLKVDHDSGHNATTMEKFKQGIIDVHAFLEQAIGPIDQEQYKASQKETSKEVVSLRRRDTSIGTQSTSKAIARIGTESSWAERVAANRSPSAERTPSR